jgi:hypothetical protein
MANNATNEDKFPMLCIPRGMLFHKTEFVENAINQAMQGKFVKKIESKTTRDKSGTEFNTFFITPDQEFEENSSTALVYKKIADQSFVNISTGKGHFFWKVKLYIPNLKAKYAPPKKVSAGPKILDDDETQAFKEWQRERAEAKRAKAAAAEKGPWDKAENIEEGELKDEDDNDN